MVGRSPSRGEVSVLSPEPRRRSESLAIPSFIRFIIHQRIISGSRASSIRRSLPAFVSGGMPRFRRSQGIRDALRFRLHGDASGGRPGTRRDAHLALPIQRRMIPAGVAILPLGGKARSMHAHLRDGETSLPAGGTGPPAGTFSTCLSEDWRSWDTRSSTGRNWEPRRPCRRASRSSSSPCGMSTSFIAATMKTCTSRHSAAGFPGSHRAMPIC